ncbi:MAG: ComF family protein [Verrucomicrobiales bacterium]|nr:ComF family protein [Verrucomicrobiales bacterium]
MHPARPGLPLCRGLLELGLGLVYPNRCQICHNEPSSAALGFVGDRCRRSLRAIEWPFCSRCGLPHSTATTREFTCSNCEGLSLAFESARAAVVAEGVALEVIHRFKYDRALWFRPLLADLLVTAALPALAGGGWTAVVPVPLHPVRQREREYNQAELLALPLARALGIPVRRDLVRRTTATRTQTHLSRSERSRNVSRAFQPARHAHMDGDSIIVLDDILTTGATTNAVAGALKRCGAGRICVWSVARAILREPPMA